MFSWPQKRSHKLEPLYLGIGTRIVFDIEYLPTYSGGQHRHYLTSARPRSSTQMYAGLVLSCVWSLPTDRAVVYVVLY